MFGVDYASLWLVVLLLRGNMFGVDYASLWLVVLLLRVICLEWTTPVSGLLSSLG